MKIIAADDELSALEMLENAISEAVPTAEVHSFGKSAEAIAFVESGFIPDAAFLDVEMPVMNGIAMAKKLKSINPDVNIIFVTGFSKYAVEAIGMRASGYLLKPVSAEKIKRELSNLRNPIKNDNSKKLVVRTFRNFEVYANGEPVVFERSKAKEIFAYLVDRQGTSASYAEVAAVIWDDGLYDRSRQKQLHTIIYSMMHSLKAVGAEDVIIKNRTGIMVDADKLDCDSYRFLEGDPAAINEYRGEYMSGYSWAEFSVGKFSEL